MPPPIDPTTLSDDELLRTLIQRTATPPEPVPPADFSRGQAIALSIAAALNPQLGQQLIPQILQRRDEARGIERRRVEQQRAGEISALETAVEARRYANEQKRREDMERRQADTEARLNEQLGMSREEHVAKQTETANKKAAALSGAQARIKQGTAFRSQVNRQFDAIGDNLDPQDRAAIEGLLGEHDNIIYQIAQDIEDGTIETPEALEVLDETRGSINRALGELQTYARTLEREKRSEKRADERAETTTRNAGERKRYDDLTDDITIIQTALEESRGRGDRVSPVADPFDKKAKPRKVTRDSLKAQLKTKMAAANRLAESLGLPKIGEEGVAEVDPIDAAVEEALRKHGKR